MFSNTGRHAQNKGINPLLIIILSVILIIAMVVVIFTSCNRNNNNISDDTPKETLFVEQEPDVVKKGEKITINDPFLGTIEIDAVHGFPKNAYDNTNFAVDENGMMTYYIDNEVASCMGVDLSEYQGDVDFNALKNQGFEFVMIRIGGRYYSEEGKFFVDANLDDYYNKAKAAGLKVGGYFFSQAKNAEEGNSEALYTLDLIKHMDFDYPIAFDWETIEGDSARTDNVTNEDLTAAALAFCDTINQSGNKAIIYSNTQLMYYKYNLEELKDIDFWVADYEETPSMYYNFTMWQYNIEGQVDGINGNVDMNICLKNY